MIADNPPQNVFEEGNIPRASGVAIEETLSVTISTKRIYANLFIIYGYGKRKSHGSKR